MYFVPQIFQVLIRKQDLLHLALVDDISADDETHLIFNVWLHTFKSKGHYDVSIEGPPLAGLIW